jgi:hypothetical protein
MDPLIEHILRDGDAVKRGLGDVPAVVLVFAAFYLRFLR